MLHGTNCWGAHTRVRPYYLQKILSRLLPPVPRRLRMESSSVGREP
jgi:hypothetical protein